MSPVLREKTLSLYDKEPEPATTVKKRKDWRLERELVCALRASNSPISWRWSKQERAKEDGVYRIRLEVTIEELLLVKN